MAPRRMPSNSPERSLRSVRCSQANRSKIGITRSLLIIVDSATVSTITIPVAAESPPMKANSASAGW